MPQRVAAVTLTRGAGSVRGAGLSLRADPPRSRRTERTPALPGLLSLTDAGPLRYFRTAAVSASSITGVTTNRIMPCHCRVNL